MRSFTPGFLDTHAISPSLLGAVRAIGEHRGREELHATRSPEVLETLREAALIASTESSNRIEGVRAPHDRIEDLVVRGAAPRDRPEQEIAGYRDVLATIHANWAHMEPSPALILQLHRDLYRYVPGRSGRWKAVPNRITETYRDGRKRVRFEPVAPHLTPGAMDSLCDGLRRESERGAIDPLLVVGAFVFDFLAVHPFLDGNGRMARLLSLLLLYRAGYGVGRYVSLERLVEETRDGYYDSLAASSRGWHDGEHSLLPWWEYFLGVVVLGAYRALEERVGSITSRRGAKRQMVLAAVRRLPETFRYADVVRACPGVSRPTIQRSLRLLRDSGEIELVRKGRDAEWTRRR